jgi:hypothetical protein
MTPFPEDDRFWSSKHPDRVMSTIDAVHTLRGMDKSNSSRTSVREIENRDPLSTARGMIAGVVCGGLIWLALAGILSTCVRLF